MKKDITWVTDNTTYTIRNVPYFTSDYDDERLIGIGVAVKLEMLADLMMSCEIEETELDFDMFADIKFSE